MVRLICFERRCDNEVEPLCWNFIGAPAWLFHLNLHASTSDPRESRQLEAFFKHFDNRVYATLFHIFFLLILIFLPMILLLEHLQTLLPAHPDGRRHFHWSAAPCECGKGHAPSVRNPDSWESSCGYTGNLPFQ